MSKKTPTKAPKKGAPKKTAEGKTPLGRQTNKPRARTRISPLRGRR